VLKQNRSWLSQITQFRCLEAKNQAVRVPGDLASRQHRERGGPAPTGGFVVSALFFFPRGGSAQVVRALARALPAAGWQLALVAGSFSRRARSPKGANGSRSSP
jgi:hypothetical protein